MHACHTGRVSRMFGNGGSFKRRIALVVALLALLVGGTAVALGATDGGTGHHRHGAHALRGGGVLGAASAYLGISKAQLEQQLRSGKSLAQIAAATPGHNEAGLIAALVAARKARALAQSGQLPAQVKALVNRPGLAHARLGRSRHRLRSTVISYLGITRRQLRSELRSGKTLAQIADRTPGKSASGLVEVIVASIATRLQTVVSQGRLSQAQEAARLAALKVRVTALVDSSSFGHAARQKTS